MWRKLEISASLPVPNPFRKDANTRHWPSPGDSSPALKLCSGGQARRPGRVHTAPEVGVQGTGSVQTSPACQSASWSRGALHCSYLEFPGRLPLAAPEGAGAALPGPASLHVSWRALDRGQEHPPVGLGGAWGPWRC